MDEKPSEWMEDYKKEYTTLPAGNYKFQVWAKDYTGAVTGPVRINFTIRPAPWFSWWAFLLYFGMGSGIIYTGGRLRMEALERRNRELEAKVKERTEELAARNQQLDNKNRELDGKNRELANKNEELVQSYKRTDMIFTALSDALPGSALDGKY